MYTKSKLILKKYLSSVLRIVLFFFLFITCSLLPPIYEKIYSNPEFSSKFLVEVDEGFSIAKTIIDSFESTSYSVYKDKLKDYEVVWIDRVDEDLCLKFIKLDENLKTDIPETILDSKKRSNIFYSSINKENGINYLDHIMMDKDGKNISNPKSICEGIYIDDINACFDSKKGYLLGIF